MESIIMLAGIYYGAMYGGATTSILVNIPGETSSVVTCIEGYQMAKRGRAGPALGISALGSYIGGTLGVIWLMILAYPLANFALKFGPPEYFSLMCLGLILATYLSNKSMSEGLIMVGVGLVLSTIGLDVVSGQTRFTFGITELRDGLDVVPLAMGLFGVSEVLLNLERPLERELFETRIKNLLPTLKDWAEAIGPIVRGSLIGFLLGILPGGGAAVSSFTSYAVEKKISTHPEKFGTGMIQGVAGPETANNAAVGGAFIPLLTLGIPSNSVMALLLGALLSYGVQVGPLFITQHSDIFWGVIASMFIGNIMLLVLNLPLIGLWVKILRVPYVLLFPLILLFCAIGAYSLNNSFHEVIIMILFGVLGYFMKKFDYEAAPLIMAMILTPMMENNLRQSLLLSHGSFTIFFTRPISLLLILLALCLLTLPHLPWGRWKNIIAPFKEKMAE